MSAGTRSAPPVGSLLTRIDYLQRLGGPPRPETARPATAADSESRRVLHVVGVGRDSKAPEPEHPAMETSAPAPGQDVLAGLYGYAVPLAFTVTGSPGDVAVTMGTWTPSPVSVAVADRQRHILTTVLRGEHPVLRANAISPEQAGRGDLTQQVWRSGGIVLGTPSVRRGGRGDVASAMDRLIRALAGLRWQALVLAQPLADGTLAAMRAQLVNEMRLVEAAARAEGAPAPLAELYTTLLKARLASMTAAISAGGWRVGVYLRGDGDSFPDSPALGAAYSRAPSHRRSRYGSSRRQLRSRWPRVGSCPTRRDPHRRVPIVARLSGRPCCPRPSSPRTCTYPNWRHPGSPSMFDPASTRW